MNYPYVPRPRGSGSERSLGEPYETIVDGEVWVVRQRINEPGTYEFTWVSGPNKNYGFTSWTNTGRKHTTAELDESIREFLVGVDPATGYLAGD